MTEQEQDYLDTAKNFLDRAQGRDTSLPEVHAQIAIAAALVAWVERMDEGEKRFCAWCGGTHGEIDCTPLNPKIGD